MKRVALTGCSGYLGSKLAVALQANGCQVLGIDVAPPRGIELDAFEQLDIGDPALARVLAEFQPDTIIHAAFVVAPRRDKQEMRRINVEGAEKVMAAAATISPQRLMIVSSATAYGAWPDNPIPMEEDWPLRARHAFPYAADKTEVEGQMTQFAADHPEIAVSWVRPTIVGGPAMDNYLHRIMFKFLFLAKLDGYDQPLQLVHEDDLVRAMLTILAADGRGPYNVAPDDSITLTEIGAETGRWVLWVPFWLAWIVYACGWTLRLPLPETPPGFLYFARYPWVIRSKRLEEELGFRFAYNSVETMAVILNNQPSELAPPVTEKI